MRWFRRRPKSMQTCVCGNYPLTHDDLAAGGECKCCRERHLLFHDDTFCRRCGCPVEKMGEGARGTTH